MTSFSLDRVATQPPYPACALPSYPRPKPLKNRWRHGRGYFVIALIAPLVLGSLLLIYLHNTTKARLNAGR